MSVCFLIFLIHFTIDSNKKNFFLSKQLLNDFCSLCENPRHFLPTSYFYNSTDSIQEWSSGVCRFPFDFHSNAFYHVSNDNLRGLSSNIPTPLLS